MQPDCKGLELGLKAGVAGRQGPDALLPPAPAVDNLPAKEPKLRHHGGQEGLEGMGGLSRRRGFLILRQGACARIPRVGLRNSGLCFGAGDWQWVGGWSGDDGNVEISQSGLFDDTGCVAAEVNHR